MPVRVKQRPMKDGDYKVRERAWELLRKTITGTLLAWDSPISLTLEGTDKDQKLRFRSPSSLSIHSNARTLMGAPKKSFDPDLIRNTLHQGAGIDLSSWGTWVKTSARTPFMVIRGMISLEAAPSRDTQFICLGSCYLRPGDGCYSLYDSVNRLFELSSFGVHEEEDGRGTTPRTKIDQRSKLDQFNTSEPISGGKGVDRWPKYFIRIELNSENSAELLEDIRSAEHRTKISSVIKVLEVMITSFLTEHFFRPQKYRSRKRVEFCLNPQQEPPCKIFRPQQDPTNIVCMKASEERLLHKGCLTETSSAVFGDLGAHVRLPSFSQSGNLITKDVFSGWSRIKGLGRETPSEGNQKAPIRKSPVSELSSVLQNGIASEAEDQHNDAPRDTSEDNRSRHTPMIIGSPTSISGLAGAQVGLATDTEDGAKKPIDHIVVADCVPEIHGQSDRTVAWKDPITQTMVQINARTGSVVYGKAGGHESNCASTNSADSVGQHRTRLRTRASNLQNVTVPFSAPAQGSWAKDFLDRWDNPVFRLAEEQISQVSPQLLENTPSYYSNCRSHCFTTSTEVTASADSSSFGAVMLTKSGLDNAKVVAQVDKKFILIKLTSSLLHQGVEKPKDGIRQTLVLVDQHAADERIRIESLLADLCSTATPQCCHLKSSLGLRSAIKTTTLLESISFSISAQEKSLFEGNASRFAKWGILYDLTQSMKNGLCPESDYTYQINILSLPGLIAERCRSNPKHLLRILREDIWRRRESGISQTEYVDWPLDHISNPSTLNLSAVCPDKTWPRSIRECPQGILDMLNSRSCRSAIMFNDVLTHENCISLIKKLAACIFPFQCAHGRPSMIPLVNIDDADGYEHGGLATGVMRGADEQELNFREAWRTFQ